MVSKKSREQQRARQKRLRRLQNCDPLIGYYAHNGPHAVCDGDGLILAGSEAEMRRILERLPSRTMTPAGRMDDSRERWPSCRTPLRMAQVIQRFEEAYRDSGRCLSQMQDRALRELRLCRTAELGGHVNRCDHCGHKQPSYNSCRNRHCNQCCGAMRAQWYQQREAEMLPVEHQHVVFTLPGQISQLAGFNGELIYRLLFQLAAEVVLRYGKDHYRVQFGLICVLHTWGQKMNAHVHLHILMPSGGLSLDNRQWVSLPSGAALPRGELMVVFRKRFLSRLKRYYREGKLSLWGDFVSLRWPDLFADWLLKLKSLTWVVHSEAANRRGPSGQAADAGQALKYLARYASGVAISNKRLVDIDQRYVTFSYKDYRGGGKRKLMKLSGVEFLRRFLFHVLPRQFRHIRNYGFLSPGKRGKALPLIRRLLGMPEAEPLQGSGDDPGDGEVREETSQLCQGCKQGRMVCCLEMPRPRIFEIMQMPLPWVLRTTAAAALRPKKRVVQLSLPLELHYLEYT